MKLYELVENYNNILELIENPDIPADILEKSLSEINEGIEAKAENIAKIIKNIEAEIEGFKQEEKRLSEKRKPLENKIKSLKSYIEESMRTTNKLKFKSKLFSFNIQNNAPSVSILDNNIIPKEYFIEQQPVLDKRKLLTDLKEGLKIEGAEVQQTSSLRIR